jgi:hypothetical protein
MLMLMYDVLRYICIIVGVRCLDGIVSLQSLANLRLRGESKQSPRILF